jgi:cystathionine beta-lyase
VHTHGSSHIGAIAHVAALDDGRQWLAQLLLELDANRTLLARLLAEHLPAIRWRAPDATYLAWLDCRDLGLGDDPSSVFLRQAGSPSGPGHSTARRPDGGSSGSTSRRRRRSSRTPWGACLPPCDSHKITER